MLALEAAIHSVCLFVAHYYDDPDLPLLKVDIENAFNECNRSSVLARVSKCFPEISAWVHWCYTQSAELRYGGQHILASADVQQGDPLGPSFLLL